MKCNNPNVAETELDTGDFSHRLSPLKNLELSCGRSYPRHRLINKSIKGLLKSAIFHLLHRMLSSLVTESLKSHGHFLDLGVEISLSNCHVEKSGFSQLERLQKSTAHTFRVWARSRLVVYVSRDATFDIDSGTENHFVICKIRNSNVKLITFY